MFLQGQGGAFPRMSLGLLPMWRRWFHQGRFQRRTFQSCLFQSPTTMDTLEYLELITFLIYSACTFGCPTGTYESSPCSTQGDRLCSGKTRFCYHFFLLCHNHCTVIAEIAIIKLANPTSQWLEFVSKHYSDVIKGMMASQITNLTIVYSTLYSGADQRKQQSSASMAFVLWINQWPVNSPHKWPVMTKMFPFDDVIMRLCWDVFYLRGWDVFRKNCRPYICSISIRGANDS